MSTKPYGVKVLDDNEAAVYITGPDGKIIGHTGIARFCKTAEEANAVTQANADMALRIAACLNACEGLPDSLLTQEAFIETNIQLTEVATERNELLAAMHRLTTLLDQDELNAVTGIFSTETYAAIDAAKDLITKAHAFPFPLVELSDLIEEHERKAGDAAYSHGEYTQQSGRVKRDGNES